MLVKKRPADDSDSDSGKNEDEEGLLQKSRKGKGEMKLVTDTELMARFYGEGDGELDHTEKFLKNYILNEGWKEKAGKINRAIAMPEMDPVKRQEVVDGEDNQREDEMEKYETAYNFRFEDPNAATMVTHARNANEEETMRRKDSARK